MLAIARSSAPFIAGSLGSRNGGISELPLFVVDAGALTAFTVALPDDVGGCGALVDGVLGRATEGGTGRAQTYGGYLPSRSVPYLLPLTNNFYLPE